MPPKVKSLEAMATQPTEEETQATQCVPDEQITQNISQPDDQTTGSGAPLETPPEHAESKNGKSGSKKLRATMASLVAMEIANDLEIYPYVVQRILDSLEKTAVASLRDHGSFRISFMTAWLRTWKARKAGEQRVFGRDVKLKATPERRTLKMAPTKSFRHKVL